MSVSTLSETRVFDRQLEYARETVIPGIWQNAIDAKPLVSVMTGTLNNVMFGSGADGVFGRGRRVLNGGESIVTKVRLGKNATVGDLGGAYASFDTTPQDTVRHSRASWKLYGGTVNLSEHEIQIGGGGHAVADLVQEESTEAIHALVDDLSTDLYSNSTATEVTPIDSIVSASSETASVFSLSGTTYTAWNSRGVSARGTAVGSIDFTSGSFATQGIADMRTCWSNASEGTIEPHAIFTTHAVRDFYEGSLQPQERFNSPRLADGGFQVLQFKTAPVFADPDCVSGNLYMLNFDHIWLNILMGADFQMGPFSEPDAQRVRIAKVFATVETGCNGRKFQNKLDTITA